MSTNTKHVESRPPDETIIIERREVIAEIDVFLGSGESMIAHAMRVAGQYIGDNLTDARMTLGFTAFGRVFSISVDGDEPMEK